MYQCITISCHVDMDCETSNSGYKSPRRSPLVPPFDDIETGIVMFITLDILISHFRGATYHSTDWRVL